MEREGRKRQEVNDAAREGKMVGSGEGWSVGVSRGGHLRAGSDETRGSGCILRPWNSGSDGNGDSGGKSIDHVTSS